MRRVSFLSITVHAPAAVNIALIHRRSRRDHQFICHQWQAMGVDRQRISVRAFLSGHNGWNGSMDCDVIIGESGNVEHILEYRITPR